MIIFRSIHYVGLYEYKICAPDYFIINIYNSTVSAGAIAIAHNYNNNINFNKGPIFKLIMVINPLITTIVMLIIILIIKIHSCNSNDVNVSLSK